MDDLRTARLRLRLFRPDDAAAFVALAGDPAVARMTSDIPCPLTHAEAAPWLRREPGEVRFALEYQGRLVGGVGYFLRPSGVGELGFWICRDMWGQGLATEAGIAVVEYGFTQGKVPALSSSHFIDNPASGRVLEKLGFTSTGHGSIWCVSRQAMVPTVEFWRTASAKPESVVRPRWRALLEKVLRPA
jgi:RimJ/RimL family protein N-acetyltransferase